MDKSASSGAGFHPLEISFDFYSKWADFHKSRTWAATTFVLCIFGICCCAPFPRICLCIYVVDSAGGGSWIPSSSVFFWSLGYSTLEQIFVLTQFANRFSKVSHVWSFTIEKCLLCAVETMSLTPAQLKLFDHCQILQVAKMMRMKKTWRDGETWIEFHKRRIRVARAYISWNSTGFTSDKILAKNWSWCGHVARLPSSRQALMLSNWCSLQWQKRGIGKLSK